MVAITNKYNYPESYYHKVLKVNSSYSRGHSDYSVTDLKKSARQVHIVRKNSDKIIKDCSDLTWSFVGSIGHDLLQSSTKSGITEKRFYTNFDGTILSGQVDWMQHNYDDLNTVDVLDYKFTSVYADIFPDTEKEWEAQLNPYKLLLERNGYKVVHLYIFAFFRDWKRRDFKKAKEGKYPVKDAKLFRIKVWPKEQTEEYIKERLKVLEENQYKEEKDLPLCTPDEQWRRGETWAVVTEQGGRALTGGVCHSREEAISVARSNYSNVKNVGVEHRRSEAIRCLDYCDAKEFCSQFTKEKELGQSIFKPLTKKEKEK